LALPLACLLFVAFGALTALVLPSANSGGVQVDSNGVVTSVDQSSEAWSDGIRPGWTVVAQVPGQTAYSDGTVVRPITADSAKRSPESALEPSLAILALAVAAYLLSLLRTGTTLAVASAALVDGVFVPERGLVGLACAGIPVLLAALFVLQVSRMAGSPRRLLWRLMCWVAIPLAATAVAWYLAGPTAAVETAAFAYLAVVWLIVLGWRSANAALVAGSTSKLAIARAVALETAPFASRLRRTGAQAERDRLASDLHAELLPAIDWRAAELERHGDSASAEVLRDLAQDVRDLVSARRLPILEDEGLVAAAEWLAESLESRGSVRVEIDLADDTGTRPPVAIERAAYRVLQLALDNVIRHAAASAATVSIAGSARALTLVVSDDGNGLEPGDAANAKRMGHLGMSDMRSEADAVGATLVVGRTGGLAGRGGSDGGTTIRFRWPA
jgi:signal transduction histidine kinase